MKVFDAGRGDHVETTEIRRSRFVATLARVDSEDDVAALRDRVETDGANHACWGFVLGSGPGQVVRCSDDGEPAGTAGVPILSAIQGRELVNAAVVVVRWFGGVKLGAGGLVRAYGGPPPATEPCRGRRSPLPRRRGSVRPRRASLRRTSARRRPRR